MDQSAQGILEPSSVEVPDYRNSVDNSTANAMQASPLPVVYKLLTADIKAGQDVAIQMLTFLCQMGAEWQTQEQLALAKFGNGVILSNLVERLGAVCNQTKLSGAKAAELASLLQLLSSATAGRLTYTAGLNEGAPVTVSVPVPVSVPVSVSVSVPVPV